MQTLGEQLIKRCQQLELEKQPYISMYELISEYVHQRKVTFTTDEIFSPQQFVPDRVFDSTAAKANFQMASSLIGALCPNIYRTFTYEPPYAMPKEMARKQENKDWYAKTSARAQQHIADPEAGFLEALEPYMHEQGSFGTSGMLLMDNHYKDPSCPLKFDSLGVQCTSIAEGSDGFVNEICYRKQVTAANLYEEYKERCSQEVITKAQKPETQDDKITVYVIIKPRKSSEAVMSTGAKAHPIAYYVVEKTTQTVLEESGYTDNPAFITRFQKIEGEVYGRSPAMSAMPDILELNGFREAEIIGVEKQLDPPLLVDPDQMLNNGEIDTSAGALNAMKLSGRADSRHKPVEPMFLVGDLMAVAKRILEIQQDVKDFFYNDDMRDLNAGGDQRMTLGEAKIRDQLRGQALIMIYSRQLNEMFSRLFQRVFNILLLHGFFGYVQDSEQYNQYVQQHGNPPEDIIPADIAKLMTSGKDVYRVNFISPAARIMRSDELSGTEQMVGMIVSQVAQGAPRSMYDVIDWDEIPLIAQELSGAPSRLIKSADQIKKLRDSMNAAAQQQAQLAQQGEQSHIGLNMAKAAEHASKAGVPIQQPGVQQ